MARWRTGGYVAAVSLLGLASLTALPALTAGRPRFGSAEFALLAAYVVLGEIYPLRVPRGGREGVLTVSTTFAFALLLHLGAAEALVALALASLVSDGLRRKKPARAIFNAAQLSLSVVLAGAVLQAVRSAPQPAPVPFTEIGWLAAAAAAVVFFLTNFLLTGVAVALATDTPVLRLLRRDLAPQATWSVVLLSLSPVVVAAADASVALLPLFLVPMVAVYKSIEVLLQRERQALLDPLTGLPNRALFADRVRQAVLRAARSAEPAAVMLLGIDRFKDVNDMLGHDGGDAVLALIGERLHGVLHDPDTVARVGGDEFGLVATPVDVERVPALVSRLVGAVHEPIQRGDVTLSLEASVGVALAPAHGTDPAALVTYADTALAQAKQLGSTWEFHEPRRFHATGNRIVRLQALRKALETQQLVLHYQPQVAVDTGQIEAYEALVRWQDPELGLVMPDRFVPLAEESGLIRDLTRYVLSLAIASIDELAHDGQPRRVAVNVAARDLQDPGLPDEVAALLRAAGVDARLLELEVTERTVMSNPAVAAGVIGRLHALGVRVAIDDFGTGNTSLRLLSDLPVDALKLDRSLVREISTNGAAIVETTIELGHRLHMTVVAEGVETVEMLERLRELGCDTVQGYLYGRPLPASALRDRQPRRS